MFQEAKRLTETSLDLDAVLAARWADPRALPATEYRRAVAFYRERRRHDRRLLHGWREVAARIADWTGCAPRDLGSLGLRLNIATSDLDLGIGCPPERWPELLETLGARMRFEGQHPTWFATTRLAFTSTLGAVGIDLSVLTEEDFAITCAMLDRIDASMTEPERVAHAWVKQLLWQQRRLDDYASWKLAVYHRFFPEFPQALELAGPQHVGLQRPQGVKGGPGGPADARPAWRVPVPQALIVAGVDVGDGGPDPPVPRVDA